MPMVVGSEAAHTPSRFSVRSSMPAGGCGRGRRDYWGEAAGTAVWAAAVASSDGLTPPMRVHFAAGEAQAGRVGAQQGAPPSLDILWTARLAGSPPLLPT